MTIINSSSSLRKAITELEAKQEAQADLLKEQFNKVKEIISPLQLLKSTIHQVAASDDIKGNLLKTGISWGAGYLSKAVFQGTSHSVTRKFFGTLLMFGVSNLVGKYPTKIRAAGLTLLDTIVEHLPHRTPSPDQQEDRPF